MVYSQRMIRWGSFKYVYNCGGIDEFFNLKEDPDEVNNLIFNIDRNELKKWR